VKLFNPSVYTVEPGRHVVLKEAQQSLAFEVWDYGHAGVPGGTSPLLYGNQS
jgi:hypothetical protein